MFTVSSTLKGDSTSSMNALEKFIADLPPEILLAQPSIQKLGNNEWAVCELTVPVEANNQTLRVIRKIFMLMHKENFIVVEGTSSSEEYENDKELFDQAVSAISSTDDLTALWMEADENASDGTPKMINVVMDGFFAQNLVYGNEPLAFRIAGPKDWYGAMQYVKEDGKLAFPLWPPALRAAYIKYYKESQVGRIFNPLFQVEVASKDDSTSSVEALRKLIALIPPERLSTQPSIQKLGNNEWAVCEFKIPIESNDQTLHIMKKIYMLLYKENLIAIRGTSTLQEYQNDKELFDQAVANIIFSDNPTELMMDILQDLSEKATKDKEGWLQPLDSDANQPSQK